MWLYSKQNKKRHGEQNELLLHIPEGWMERRGVKGILKTIMTGEFSQTDERHESTESLTCTKYG